MSYPYRWQPTILPLQILIISTNAIIAVPAELTTMAGRRLKNAISTQLKEDNTIPSTGHVILSSLSNSYSSYITTFEEYQIQRYEGGSTIYGPHTLMAYIDQFTRLATTFKDGFLKSADGHEGVSNPISLLPPILMDLPILNLPVTWFGTVLKQPEDCFIKSTVVVGFVCGHPRTNSNQRFCSVEKRFDNRWIEFLSDGGLDVGYKWKRIGVMSGYCECDWRVGFTYLVGGGEYRMRYTGKHKMLGYIGAEVGVSKSFKVLDFSSNDDM